MQPDNALFGCRMLSSFISVVSAFIGDQLQRRHRGDLGLARKRLENQYLPCIPVILQVSCALAASYSAHPWASPRRG
ncbi:hypothetical protein D7W96_05345 [Salmonella enterica]|uniref:Uncharacterized protein n=5 Tax=Salmonella enterica TaxID=28901 RepID=A0A3Y0ER67_SALET|nr:hypothetical protein LFZ15_02010 [Salmonella enterica subsp. enterica serovar Hvittingfoss str. SA20014981]AXD64262.1 hypothetical protein CHC41_24295 [Salmonella enterica]EAA0508619.1 hypothetical protein [Salmonella enterica subsp. enterica]EAA1472899.1 hypothetical protein [Salmonella enterica subsp. enterica serovar Hvittingfoss]EAA2240505.1 hypothetical protein [Salmonella enterica subsp. enterica serovar Singapore]EAA3639639.1 hypothetical protein [Salmonella enterica subsp. enterica 